MRFVIVAFIALLMSLTSRADCFREHVREAAELNQARLPLYSDASQGASRKISKALIQMERQMLFFSSVFTNYDRWAEPYESRGIGVTCESYISMSETPSFLAQDPEGEIPAAAQFAAGAVVDRGELWAAYDLGLDHLIPVATRKIQELKKQPRLNCLTTHFLESIVRIAHLAPKHERAAWVAGLESPTWIHQKMIWGHLFFMRTAMSIDASARPLQAKGIPIVCRDLPAIPFHLSN